MLYFYDLDNKEYIGGKFIYGKDGKVEIKDIQHQEWLYRQFRTYKTGNGCSHSFFIDT